MVTQAGADDLAAVRALDPDFVSTKAAALAGALDRVLAALRDGGVALIVGHSPTNEATILGLTGQLVDPMAMGHGVRIVADHGGAFTVTPLA